MPEDTDLPIFNTIDASEESMRQRIIKAAAEVFAKNGYARTTTRKLAAAAGITEVTLFRHFGSKEKLFAAAVESYGGRSLAAELEATLTGDYRADMHNLGRRFMQVAVERSPIIRLMFSEAAHFPEMAQALAENPRQMRRMLSRYLKQHIERGTIMPLDTDIAAQAFWGMILSYSLIADSYAEEIPDGMTPEEAARHFVNIFIDGTIQKE